MVLGCLWGDAFRTISGNRRRRRRRRRGNDFPADDADDGNPSKSAASAFLSSATTITMKNVSASTKVACQRIQANKVRTVEWGRQPQNAIVMNRHTVQAFCRSFRHAGASDSIRTNTTFSYASNTSVESVHMGRFLTISSRQERCNLVEAVLWGATNLKRLTLAIPLQDVPEATIKALCSSPSLHTLELMGMKCKQQTQQHQRRRQQQGRQQKSIQRWPSSISSSASTAAYDDDSSGSMHAGSNNDHPPSSSSSSSFDVTLPKILIQYLAHYRTMGLCNIHILRFLSSSYRLSHNEMTQFAQQLRHYKYALQELSIESTIQQEPQQNWIPMLIQCQFIQTLKIPMFDDCNLQTTMNDESCNSLHLNLNSVTSFPQFFNVPQTLHELHLSNCHADINDLLSMFATVKTNLHTLSITTKSTQPPIQRICQVLQIQTQLISVTIHVSSNQAQQQQHYTHDQSQLLQTIIKTTKLQTLNLNFMILNDEIQFHLRIHQLLAQPNWIDRIMMAESDVPFIYHLLRYYDGPHHLCL
mmetsp:Transcript_9671/g.27523  ORF Transcript_9671/g.27523 Transcript_9671/m.27523 type:complete len:529 (-) Transcript_9671:1800-3386(-)